MLSVKLHVIRSVSHHWSVCIMSIACWRYRGNGLHSVVVLYLCRPVGGARGLMMAALPKHTRNDVRVHLVGCILLSLVLLSLSLLFLLLLRGAIRLARGAPMLTHKTGAV